MVALKNHIARAPGDSGSSLDLPLTHSMRAGKSLDSLRVQFLMSKMGRKITGLLKTPMLLQ